MDGFKDTFVSFFNLFSKKKVCIKNTTEDGDTLLHLAVRNQEQDIVKFIFNNNSNINCKNKNSDTPLHCAVRNEDKEIVEILLNRNANVNCQNIDGNTPLHCAVRNEVREIVELLLSRNADVNLKNNSGDTVLQYAVENKDELIVKMLLDKNAVVDSRSEHCYTPLHFAAESGTVGIVKLLLDKNADVKAVNKFGETPLYSAIHKGREDIVKLLLEHGAEVRVKSFSCIILRDYTPLHLAILRDSSQIVQLLVQYDNNFNITLSESNRVIHFVNDLGETPLHLSVFKQNAKTVEFLLKNKANVNANSVGGRTPLHYASYYYNDTAEGNHIIELLLNNGADINIICDEKGMTPFQHFYKLRHYLHLSMKHHIVKLNILKHNVSSANLRLIINDDSLSDFNDECYLELERLKNENILGTNTSYYSFLIKNSNQLASVAKNESLVEIIKSTDHSLKFPIFSNILYNQLRKGEKRRRLIERLHNECICIFPSVPYECRDKIVSYLNNKEIYTLIVALSAKFTYQHRSIYWESSFESCYC